MSHLIKIYAVCKFSSLVLQELNNNILHQCEKPGVFNQILNAYGYKRLANCHKLVTDCWSYHTDLKPISNL